MAAKKKAKPAARKAAPKKKAAAKKKPAAKKAAPKAAAKRNTAAIRARWNKTQILNEISEAAALSRKQVGDVLEHLSDAIERHVKKGGVGEFVMPGLFKITTKKKPAVKAGMRYDPFKKEMRKMPAKPASTQVKVRPLKKLKDMAG